MLCIHWEVMGMWWVGSFKWKHSELSWPQFFWRVHFHTAKATTKYFKITHSNKLVRSSYTLCSFIYRRHKTTARLVFTVKSYRLQPSGQANVCVNIMNCFEFSILWWDHLINDANWGMVEKWYSVWHQWFSLLHGLYRNNIQSRCTCLCWSFISRDFGDSGFSLVICTGVTRTPFPLPEIETLGNFLHLFFLCRFCHCEWNSLPCTELSQGSCTI